jgi:hypothetical protein
MNGLNSIRIGLALAITTGLLNVACALLVAVAPEAMTNTFQTWWHGIDVTQLAVTPPPMSLISVVTGVVTLMLAAFVSGWLFATLYNAIGRFRSDATLPTAGDAPAA